MNIQINTIKLKSLSPCKDRLDNWLKHYSIFNGDIIEFLSLTEISAKDKVWVSVRLLPREQLEYFAIDCAFAAAYTAAAAAERERQVDCLIYLIETAKQ